jgi:hypothetical protein
MAETLLEHVYRLKGGEEVAVEYENPLLERREPIVVYCKDGVTRMKIGDGVHRYNELSWVGGTNSESADEVLDFKTSGDFPNIGEAHKIYKAERESKLYQWNSEKFKYEQLNVVDVQVDVTDIEFISGGEAEDLI